MYTVEHIKELVFAACFDFVYESTHEHTFKIINVVTVRYFFVVKG